MKNKIKLLVAFGLVTALTSSLVCCSSNLKQLNKGKDNSQEEKSENVEVNNTDGPSSEGSSDSDSVLNEYDDNGNVIGKIDPNEAPKGFDASPKDYVLIDDADRVHGGNNYLEKLNAIDSCLDDPTLFDKSTAEAKSKVGAEYNTWKSNLDEIYNKVISSVPDKYKSAIEQEEKEWEEVRDKLADEASNKYEGGTAEELEKIISLAQQTRDRCYVLVNQYMD